MVLGLGLGRGLAAAAAGGGTTKGRLGRREPARVVLYAAVREAHVDAAVRTLKRVGRAQRVDAALGGAASWRGQHVCPRCLRAHEGVVPLPHCVRVLGFGKLDGFAADGAVQRSHVLIQCPHRALVSRR